MSLPMTKDEMIANAVSWIMAARKEYPKLLPPGWVFDYVSAQRSLTTRAAHPTEQGGEYCVCKKPIVEKGFCFVCQSPIAPRPRRSVGG